MLPHFLYSTVFVYLFEPYLVMNRNQQAIILAYERGYRIDYHGYAWNPKGDQINGSENKNGYLRISIRDGIGPIFVFFHRLQAYQKYGVKIFEKGIVVRHKNGVPSNNSFENILIGTHQDNHLDKPRVVIDRCQRIATDAARKYNKEEVKDFYIKHGWSKTMCHFGIKSKGTMSYIINH